MKNNVRWRRPKRYVHAMRKLGARAASAIYSPRRKILHPPFEGSHAAGAPRSAEAQRAASQAQPKPQGPRKRASAWTIFKRVFWLTLLLILLVVGWLVLEEVRTSERQAEFFSKLAKEVSFAVKPGASNAIRYPKDSPYDERLGYSSLPDFLGKLQARDFKISAQAQVSAKSMELTDMGLFSPYHEKTQVGLAIFDCRKETLFSARYPERIYAGFEDTPEILINSLLFIENRELLDPRYPKRNPAVEWDRLSKAVFDQAVHTISGDRKSGGGSTLATQIEKYRHSPEGRTASLKDKLRQMVSATMRAYQQGEDTTAARRQLVVDYLNTVPLSAKPGYGEVNGVGDGMQVWYGRDFAEVNQILKSGKDLSDPTGALAYKQALSLLVAQRRPSYYLGDDESDLDELTNSHLRLLAGAGVIPLPLRDAALKVSLEPSRAAARKSVANVAPNSFVTRKASTAVRAQLAGLLGDSGLYKLDRLDLSVDSTLDAQAQQAVTRILSQLRDNASAEAAGLKGKGLLEKGDPANIIYSFTLLERGDNNNYLRVQTDNFEQPLDINEGAKLDLGSTAKLRTLVTYLDIIAQLHARYSALDADALRKTVIDPKDVISRWAIDYILRNPGKDMPAMLDAALERRYSANPAEGFFTGGGMHTFNNFNKEDNNRILSVRESLRHSVNLVFVRLLRDVVHYYMFQTPGSSASLLHDADDPRREGYLSRFADREGRDFLYRFYRKYQGKSAADAEALLLQGMRPTPVRLASVFRTIAPDAPLSEFVTFLKENLPSQNEVSPEKAANLYQQHDPAGMSLADRGYLATVHPLELWIVGYLRNHPTATMAQARDASADERQVVYSWLFNTNRKHAQDSRILGLLEVEGFLEIHRQWKRMGYPFDSLVPSYATALGASADRPAALAELMGVLVNGGVRKPSGRIASLHFASATPYETILQRNPGKGEQVLPKEVATAVLAAIRDVVEQGTARRVKTAFARADGSVIPVGGKTGTGDQRYDVYGARGVLIESRFVNRSATFVFNIGERFFGSITAYVHGPQAENYSFTSALPVQLLKVLAPSLMPLVDPAEGATQAKRCGG
ncbi:MAG: transglycosylase domain-containing protein [Pseudomonadota bacterium]